MLEPRSWTFLVSQMLPLSQELRKNTKLSLHAFACMFLLFAKIDPLLLLNNFKVLIIFPDCLVLPHLMLFRWSFWYDYPSHVPIEGSSPEVVKERIQTQKRKEKKTQKLLLEPCLSCFVEYCLWLFLIFDFTGTRMVPMAEAKDCHKVWNCKGEDNCWEDCKNRYHGKGMCDLYTAPGVPKQCFCAYKC